MIEHLHIKRLTPDSRFRNCDIRHMDFKPGLNLILSDGKKLRDGMKTKFDVYFIEGSKLPYSFHDYEAACHVGNFKSINGMIKHIKKCGFIFQSVELEYIEEYKND